MKFDIINLLTFIGVVAVLIMELKYRYHVVMASKEFKRKEQELHQARVKAAASIDHISKNCPTIIQISQAIDAGHSIGVNPGAGGTCSVHPGGAK